MQHKNAKLVMKTISLKQLGPENSTAMPTLQVQQGPGENASKGGIEQELPHIIQQFFGLFDD